MAEGPIKDDELGVKDLGKDKIMRQIVIETDGDNIKIVKAEVAGGIELVAIFKRLIEHLDKK
jgi:hypothetical protein